MNLYCLDYELHYEAANTARLFYRDLHEMPENSSVGEEKRIVANLFFENDTAVASCLVFDGKLYYKEARKNADLCKNKNQKEIFLAQVMYDLLSEITGLTPPWGILTGVRPVKLIRSLRQEFGDGLNSFLLNDCRVSQKKLDIAFDTEARENKLLKLSKKSSVSIYISIPFCPSRCNYCSFVSRTVERAGKLISDYVELLSKEIKVTGEYVKKLRLKVESVYFGGGTPTVLTAEQLEILLNAVNNSFDLSDIREYTVEGGRPDTITEDKLQVLLKYGVNRLSINPQTMNDKVLSVIGRRHTAEEIVSAYELARNIGIPIINMDLIAGLPEDTFDSFKNTLDRVITLAPENITVHTLSVKRSSFINEKNISLPEDREVEKMVEYSAEKLYSAGYNPYYMYRQRNTLANAENIGWAKEGTESCYNVYIMDETHSIFACGAGAVTKLREPEGDDIQRIFNYKYPYEYISRFDELLKRKEFITEFYADFIL